MGILKSNVGKYIAEWEIDEYEKYLHGQVHHEPYFVVIDHGEIVACGGYGVENNVAILSWGLVKRNRHRTGIGTTLLKYRLKSLFERNNGIPLRIDTSQHTQGFYQKFGFHPIEVVKDGYEKGMDKVYMEYRGN